MLATGRDGRDAPPRAEMHIGPGVHCSPIGLGIQLEMDIFPSVFCSYAFTWALHRLHKQESRRRGQREEYQEY